MSKKSEAVSDGLTIYHYIVIFDILARLAFENRTDTFLLVYRQRKPEGEYWRKRIKELGAENIPMISNETFRILMPDESTYVIRKTRDALLDLDKVFIDSKKTKPLIKIEPFLPGRVHKLLLPGYPWRTFDLPKRMEVPADFFPVSKSLYEVIEIIDHGHIIDPQSSTHGFRTLGKEAIEMRRLQEENKKLMEANENLEGELYDWKYGV